MKYLAAQQSELRIGIRSSREQKFSRNISRLLLGCVGKAPV
ncbi:hypothetical protein [Bradyrhizobium diazoefficiens]